jgi:hypothetical protein
MRPLYRCLTGLPVALVVAWVPLVGQQTTAASAQTRTSAIAASFSKFKNMTKEKFGIRKSKYLRVQSEPAVKANPADYSGSYQVADLDFRLELRVNRDGSFDGRGYEPLGENVQRSFVLRNGKIEGALLTATKVYADGKSEPFEGAFMNRSVYESPTDRGATIFGFGMLGKPITFSGYTIDKFFFEKKQ